MSLPNYTHYIKARKKGERAWYFITPKGGMIRLRVHASLFTSEAADKVLEGIAKDNPEYDFKKVPIR